MASDYADVDDLAADLGITNLDQIATLALALTAASRQIDGWCGRRFWQDESVTVREFYPDDRWCMSLLDQPTDEPKVEISTTTGLIVKTDDAGDGTFGTTLTIGTDFLLLPRNAEADGRPYSEIRRLDTSWPNLSNGRAAVQITAQFGWATIPSEVERATRIQAGLLYKSKDAPLGAMSLGEVGTLYARSAIHPTAIPLLRRFQIPPVG